MRSRVCRYVCACAPLCVRVCAAVRALPLPVADGGRGVLTAARAAHLLDRHVCFRLTHFLLAGFCAVGAFAALALARRLRRHYAMLREGSSRFSVTKGVRATSSVQVADTGRLASGDSAGPSLGSDDIYS